jgi:hypothetical protein
MTLPLKVTSGVIGQFVAGTDVVDSSVLPASGAGSGSVTYVGLTVPGVLFSVAGSPVTSSGTFAFSLLTQTANTLLCGPTTSPSATPSFRTLVDADLSSTNAAYKNVNNHFTAAQDITLASGGAALFLHRLNTGTDNGGRWMLQIDNAGATDTLAIGCTSTTYTTGGSLTWAGNSGCFIYYPSGNGLRISSGTGATTALYLDGSNNGTFGNNLTVNGSTTLVGLSAHGGTFNYSSNSSLPDSGSYISQFWIPRFGDLSNVIFQDYQDELYYAHKIATVTLSGTPDSGTGNEPFVNDSSFATWNSGSTVGTIQYTIDYGAGSITAKNSGTSFALGITTRSGSGAQITNVKVEFYDNSVPGYTQVFSGAPTVLSGNNVFLTGNLSALSGSSFNIPKLRITLTLNNPTTGVFRLERLMLYHATAAWDPWKIDVGGGTMYGNLTMGDAVNIPVGTTTGTKIGTSTSQKLGFFNATPVAQQGSTADLRTGLINLGFFASGGASPLNLNGGALTVGSATIADAGNVAVGTTTGTIIGTSTSQKLGFFNATPVVQNTSTTDLRTGLINLGFFASGGASPLNLNGGALTVGSATLADAGNIAVGTTTGTIIATSTSQKLGFFNKTPVIQPASTDLLTACQNLGLVASSVTAPAPAKLPWEANYSTPPGTSSWTGYNMGSGSNLGTFTASGNGLFLRDSVQSGTWGDHARVQYITLSSQSISAPWTLVARVVPFLTGYNNQNCGVAFLDTTTNKFAGFEWSQQSTGSWAIDKWTDGNTKSGNYIGTAQYQGGWAWVKLIDDNTNRKVYGSMDGSNWILLHSVSRTDFITNGANAVCFWVNANNSNGANVYDAGILIMSWNLAAGSN